MVAVETKAYGGGGASGVSRCEISGFGPGNGDFRYGKIINLM